MPGPAVARMAPRPVVVRTPVRRRPTGTTRSRTARHNPSGRTHRTPVPYGRSSYGKLRRRSRCGEAVRTLVRPLRERVPACRVEGTEHRARARRRQRHGFAGPHHHALRAVVDLGDAARDADLEIVPDVIGRDDGYSPRASRRTLAAGVSMKYGRVAAARRARSRGRRRAARDRAREFEIRRRDRDAAASRRQRRFPRGQRACGRCRRR